MKKVLIIPFALILAGCNTTAPVVTSSSRLVVVMPNEAIYNCPTVRSFPDPKTLTDIQVGRLILQLYQNNRVCKNSVESIKFFLDDAKKKIEQRR